jgi:hypothetical protein
MRKEIFMQFLQVKGLIDPNPDIVPNHRSSEQLSVNKSDSEWSAPGNTCRSYFRC